MPFLKTLGVTKAEQGQAVMHSIGSVAGLGMVDNPYRIAWDVERAVRDGLERSIWVYRCVNTIASILSSKDVVIREGGRGLDRPIMGQEGKAIPADAWGLLTALNKKANSFETGMEFRYRMFAQLLLAKQGVFIEVLRRNNGQVGALYLLPAGRTWPIPDQETFVSGYRVETVRGDIINLKPENVLWLRIPHPTDPYSSQTPMEAAGLSIDTDFYAKLFNRSYLANDGTKRAIIAVKGDLLDDDAEELRRRWGTGPSNAGGVSVIEADDVSIVEPGGNNRDAQYVESQSITKKDIIGAFGLSESFVGDASGRCVDGETEALTQRGWVSGPELKVGDQILSMDMASGQMTWGPVREVYEKHDYTGPMYRLQHSHIDARVSAGHKWVVESRAGQGQKKTVAEQGRMPYEKVKVEDLTGHDRIAVMGDAEVGAAEAEFSNAFVELVGWSVTEGHYTPNGWTREHRPGTKAHCIRLRQNPGEGAERITACLKELGARFIHRDGDGTADRWDVRGEIAAAVQAVSPGRVMTQEFMLSLTREQRDLLIETMVDADGARQDGTRSVIYTQKSREMAENFLFLCTLAGRRCSIRRDEFKRSYDGADAVRWVVIVGVRKVMTIQRDTRVEEAGVEGGQYIWCPRTDHGTFVARRGGKVFVTSNTFDNADAEEEIAWRNGLLPNLRLVDLALDTLWGEGTVDDDYLVHDLSDVAVLQRDDWRKAERAQVEVEKGLITIDEYRAITGRDPVARAGSQVLWIAGQGKVAIGDEADEKKASELPVLGGAAAGAGVPPGAGGAGAAVDVGVGVGDRTRREVAADNGARSGAVRREKAEA